MKTLPIGISDYKKIIEGNYYYVDKTLFIKEFWETAGQVKLITRPRRFGKTLNLSTLKYFFEHSQIKYDYLFHRTAIWQETDLQKLQGKYPIISLTFKNIKESQWATAQKNFALLIAAEYKRHSYLMSDLTPHDREIFMRLQEARSSYAELCLSGHLLSKLLSQYHQKNVIVLIDEYDTPLHAAYINGYYEEAVSFIGALMAAVFKDNVYLERGLLTGVLRVISGLNNLTVFTLLDGFFCDKFGFTLSEVEQLLDDQQLSPARVEIKSWYNGYLCGDTLLYNSWSVLECATKRGILLPYWVNTSDNELIINVIVRADEQFKEDLGILLLGLTTKQEINETIALSAIKKDAQASWSFLLSSGYLTPVKYEVIEGKHICDLGIPNKEIKALYQDLIRSIFNQVLTATRVKELLQALTTADAAPFAQLLQEFVVNSMNTYGTISEPEKSYHLFVLGLQALLSDQYEITSSRRHGHYDVMVIPRDNTKKGMVMAFKKVSTESETLESAALKALEHIEQHEYKQKFIARGIGNILAFGIAFKAKEIFVKIKEL